VKVGETSGNGQRHLDHLPPRYQTSANQIFSYERRAATYFYKRNRDQTKTNKLQHEELVILQAKPVLRIRISVFLDLPDPESLVRGTDSDPSITKQNK
jgi:hypothetical protein